jgi:DNA-directed RNA polymerase subunit F
MKNFMGVGGPDGKKYGLSRRMVQIYLLCLVQQGKIRITLGPKSGLPSSYIDYKNISDTDFTARVLDSMLEVQRLAPPENWEVLRPYAEKILAHELKITNDDAIISGYCKELIDHFEKERDQSSKVLAKAKVLFSTLGINNPYEKEVEQAAALFANDLGGGKDIEAVLYALDQAFGYRVFQQTSPDQREIDDLANRLDNSRKIEKFLESERELEAIQAYCSYALPDQQELSSLREMQKALSLKLKNLQPYIDSEVRLGSELIGRDPPQAGESGTLWSLIHEYTLEYAAMHDSVMVRIEENRRMVQEMLQSDDMKALGVLEKITAIQQNDTAKVRALLQKQSTEIFSCPSSSRSSIDKDLKIKPEHGCGLSFVSASRHLELASQKSEEACGIFDDALNKRMEFFLSPGIRERLRQGESEPEIAALLECQTLSEVRSCLTEACLRDPTLVDKINRYLKRVLVKSVRISDFKPSTRTIERNQIDDLVSAFKKFLEEQFENGDPDSRQMLQLE